MKVKIYIFIIFLFGVLLMQSCNKDFLDTTPLTEFSDATVWTDPPLVETFINNIYWRLDEPFSSGRLKANLVDEGHYRGNAPSLNFNKCLLTPDQIPGLSTPSRYLTWNDIYKSIRFCNIFFEKVKGVPFDNTVTDGKTMKERLTGEAHFLRAYNYFLLTRMYGGVPIITKAYELTDDFLIARDSYAKCVDFMVAECDTAISLLPATNSGDNKGRATMGAAMTLKSRILLYAASDLFNTTVFPGYSNPEYIGYTDANRTARWQKAKDAAKAVIALGQYSLYKAIPLPGDSVAKNINEMFLAKNTVEDIFVKYFTTNSTQQIALVSGPNGWHNWGTNAPLGDFVDDIEMKNGTPFSWSNPVHAASPYKNRDPRFYANILYEGAVWKPRTADVAPTDPLGIVQVGRWEKWDAATSKTVITYGLDTRQSPIENWNGGYPGYYLRKYQDPAVDAQYFYQTVPWRFFRYGEIILNYAEACIELGGADLQNGINALNLVRNRAGLPDRVTADQATARTYLRQERAIEFFGEGHRYYDLRKWMAYPSVITNVYEMKIKQMENGNMEWKLDLTANADSRTWGGDKYYWVPLTRDEMNKAPSLQPQPGY